MPELRLELLGTTGCHLCEQATALLAQAATARRFLLDQVDIAEENALLMRYQERIPVLRMDTGLELPWPFGLLDILVFIDAAATR